MITNKSDSYKWLQMISNSHKWLQMINDSHKWLQIKMIFINDYK